MLSVKSPSSSPVTSACWEISSGFAFSHDSTAGTRRRQPRRPWSSDYSLNVSWHCRERAVRRLRLSNDSRWEELRAGSLVNGGTVAHTSRARLPFEVITRSLYSGEANDAHFNVSITKKRNHTCGFPEQHVHSSSWRRHPWRKKEKKKTACLLNAIIFTSRKTCQNIFPQKPALFVKFSAD